MNIGSKSGYPSSALSNFAPHKFIFDGVECNSMEGLLQSLKFSKPHIQEEICKLVGLSAKRRGSQKNSTWKKTQTLWWKGNPIDRHGKEYQILLTEMFQALSDQNDSFKKALLATGDAVLKHTMGKSNPHDTVLTESEFISRLTLIREKLKSLNNNS